MAVASNTDTVAFGLATTGAWPDPTHVSVWIDGVHMGSTPLTSPITGIAANESIQIAAGALSMTLPNGEATNAFSERCLRGGVGAAEVRLHSGPPGADGTANQISGDGYEHAAVAAWSVS